MRPLSGYVVNNLLWELFTGSLWAGAVGSPHSPDRTPAREDTT